MTTGDPHSSTPAPAFLDARSGQKFNGLLVRVLAKQHIRAVYQPIVTIADQAEHGYEALARPSSEETNVAEFFVNAERLGIGRDLDWLCRRAAVSSADHLEPGVKLFLNLNASTLIDAELDASLMLQMVSTSGLRPEDIVLEITHHALTMGAVRLPVVAAIYHHYGLRVALADFEQEHEPFEVLQQCKIDYIKLARSVAANLDAGNEKLVTEALAYADGAGVLVVGEGIEREEQAQRLGELGVSIGQGYFYGRPAPFEDVVE